MIIADARVPVASSIAMRNFSLSKGEQILIMPVGDVHAFSEHWPKERFRDHIKWGVDRGAYFLGMGEYFDFTSTSQRDILLRLRESQRKEIDDSRKEKVEELAKLIACSRGRWLGLLEGHHYHEYLDGITTDQHLCQLLECPFLGTSTLMELSMMPTLPEKWKHKKLTVCTIYAHHGNGGGKKQGSHLHRVEDLITMVEADIYLMGHSHSKANAPIDRLYRTPSGYLYHRTKLIARTGAFLRGYAGTPPQPLTIPAAASRGSYVEKGGYVPSALGGLVISVGVKHVCGQTETGKKYHVAVPDIHYSV